MAASAAAAAADGRARAGAAPVSASASAPASASASASTSADVFYSILVHNVSMSDVLFALQSAVPNDAAEHAADGDGKTSATATADARAATGANATAGANAANDAAADDDDANGNSVRCVSPTYDSPTSPSSPRPTSSTSTSRSSRAHPPPPPSLASLPPALAQLPTRPFVARPKFHRYLHITSDVLHDVLTRPHTDVRLPFPAASDASSRSGVSTTSIASPTSSSSSMQDIAQVPSQSQPQPQSQPALGDVSGTYGSDLPYGFAFRAPFPTLDSYDGLRMRSAAVHVPKPPQPTISCVFFPYLAALIPKWLRVCEKRARKRRDLDTLLAETQPTDRRFVNVHEIASRMPPASPVLRSVSSPPPPPPPQLLVNELRLDEDARSAMEMDGLARSSSAACARAQTETSVDSVGAPAVTLPDNHRLFLYLVSGYGTPWDPSLDQTSNSTKAAAKLLALYLARFYPQIEVILVHSAKEVFHYDANVQFVQTDLRPRIEAQRRELAQQFNDQWSKKMHITVSIT